MDSLLLTHPLVFVVACAMVGSWAVASSDPQLIPRLQVVHIIFKRWEPMQIPYIFLLLAAVPAISSVPLVVHRGVVVGLGLGVSMFYLFLTSSIVLYRISPIHPLHRYPGPLRAKITKWWYIWKVRGGKQHIYVEALHRKYGDIVRIGESYDAIFDRRLYRLFLTHRTKRSQYTGCCLYHARPWGSGNAKE